MSSVMFQIDISSDEKAVTHRFANPDPWAAPSVCLHDVGANTGSKQSIAVRQVRQVCGDCKYVQSAYTVASNSLAKHVLSQQCTWHSIPLQRALSAKGKRRECLIAARSRCLQQGGGREGELFDGCSIHWPL